jgi:UDP-3-O-[3-hydroxymyristoyl] glucosamine N-acyltransferase
VAGHITIGKGSKAGGQAGLTADVAPGAYVNGTPAIPYMTERRLQILHQKLPEIFKRVEKLEAGAE